MIEKSYFTLAAIMCYNICTNCLEIRFVHSINHLVIYYLTSGNIIMSKYVTAPVTTVVGDLEWVNIVGEGKEDLQGNMQYLCTVVLEGEKAEQLKATIDTFWEENKPSGMKKPKSTGYYPHKVPTGEEDDEGNKIYEETGKTAFTFKTGTAYKDGKPKVIKVFNAKGVEVDLGDKRIGNGSRGRVQGAVAIYGVESKGKVLQAGTTLYLNGVQLAKLVEYAGGPQFDSIEEEDADFEGAGDVGAIQEETSEAVSAKAAGSKPRI